MNNNNVLLAKKLLLDRESKHVIRILTKALRASVISEFNDFFDNSGYRELFNFINIDTEFVEGIQWMRASQIKQYIVSESTNILQVKKSDIKNAIRRKQGYYRPFNIFIKDFKKSKSIMYIECSVSIAEGLLRSWWNQSREHDI